FVSPLHVRLERTSGGGWRVQDLKSENGLFLESPPRPISEAELNFNDVFRVGRTLLRLRNSSDPIPPTRLDRGPQQGWFMALSQPWCVLLLFSIFFAGVAVYNYLGEYEELSTKTLATHVIVVFFSLSIAIFLWCGVWSLVTRILRSRFFFLAHAAAACLGAILIFSFLNVCSYAAFSLSLGSK